MNGLSPKQRRYWEPGTLEASVCYAGATQPLAGMYLGHTADTKKDNGNYNIPPPVLVDTAMLFNLWLWPDSYFRVACRTPS